jgi:hypothetical protein
VRVEFGLRCVSVVTWCRRLVWEGVRWCHIEQKRNCGVGWCELGVSKCWMV